MEYEDTRKPVKNPKIDSQEIILEGATTAIPTMTAKPIIIELTGLMREIIADATDNQVGPWNFSLETL
jgi:hypothetical protein